MTTPLAHTLPRIPDAVCIWRQWMPRGYFTLNIVAETRSVIFHSEAAAWRVSKIVNGSCQPKQTVVKDSLTTENEPERLLV